MLMRQLCSFLAAIGMLVGVGSAHAERLAVKRVTASSSKPESMGVTFGPDKAADGQAYSHWAEGESAGGLGDWIDFKFPKTSVVTRMVIYNGNWDSKDFFLRSNRVKKLRVKGMSGLPEEYELQDTMERQEVVFKKPLRTRSIKLILKDVYPGSTFNDTCISEVQFFNDLPGHAVMIAGAEATSALKSDPDASYGAGRVVDGLRDTVWCEGKEGAGVGEVITLKLGGDVSLETLEFLNGVAASEDTFQKNNRVIRMKLEFGTTVKEVGIPDIFGQKVQISLGGVKASTIRLTILETTPGTHYNDTCISELSVLRAP